MVVDVEAGQVADPLDAETNQQFGAGLLDRQTGMEKRAAGGGRTTVGYASLRPATPGKVLILIVAEFSP